MAHWKERRINLSQKGCCGEGEGEGGGFSKNNWRKRLKTRKGRRIG
jgi:hypothetical protein